MVLGRQARQVFLGCRRRHRCQGFLECLQWFPKRKMVGTPHCCWMHGCMDAMMHADCTPPRAPGSILARLVGDGENGEVLGVEYEQGEQMKSEYKGQDEGGEGWSVRTAGNGTAGASTGTDAEGGKEGESGGGRGKKQKNWREIENFARLEI